MQCLLSRLYTGHTKFFLSFWKLPGLFTSFLPSPLSHEACTVPGRPSLGYNAICPIYSQAKADFGEKLTGRPLCTGSKEKQARITDPALMMTHCLSIDVTSVDGSLCSTVVKNTRKLYSLEDASVLSYPCIVKTRVFAQSSLRSLSYSYSS